MKREPFSQGGTYVRLDRTEAGEVMCQLCFGFFPIEELNEVPGGVEDVCKPCAEVEGRVRDDAR